MESAKLMPHPALKATLASKQIEAIKDLPANQVQEIFNSTLAQYGTTCHKILAPLILHLVATGYIGIGDDEHRDFLSSLSYFFEQISDAASIQ